MLLPFATIASTSAQGPAIGHQCIELRSGGGQGITFLASQGPLAPLLNAPFDPATFAAACAGLPAVEPTSTNSWLPGLPADPTARWIAVDQVRTPRSTLFCQSFDVPACTLQSASLQFWFAADDQLGDPVGGPNQVGVYLNGQPVPGFSGGNYGGQTYLFQANVAPLLVAGTNHLQIYQRDMAASLSGVIYSARICYLPCQPVEVVRLRSGAGQGITFVAAQSPMVPLQATPFDPSTFSSACAGSPAAAVTSTNSWLPSLPSDPAARWISVDPVRTPRSTLFCQPFWIPSCALHAATLRFWFAADDQLGDPNGPNPIGVYLNGQPIAGFSGGNYSSETSLFHGNVAPYLAPGINHLQVYQRDLGASLGGVIYAAELTVVPCVSPETIVLRSAPNQGIRYMHGPSMQPLSTVPFTPGDFALADVGLPAVIGADPGVWLQSLPCDNQAVWMGVDNPRTPYSALYSHPFTVTTCSSSIRRVKLEICFATDDQLGDPPLSGGGNQCGIYVNGHAVPLADTFGNYANSTSFTAMIPSSWIQTGANTLYVYNRDLGGGYSGVLYSCRLSISPCTPYFVYDSGCGDPPPSLSMRNQPRIGGSLDVRIATRAPMMSTFTILGVSDSWWNGASLPFDLSTLGATGCRLLASLDVPLPLQTTDSLGEANFALPIPSAAGLIDKTVYFQTLALDAPANPLGLSFSAGYAVVVQRP
ncbi:MAG: hypothetical protein IPM29_01880 [Planctomycetes bacterium]|nr:hypothetical protein [Planctomycetota bacterium]